MKTVLIYSGGLDSTVLLTHYLDLDYDVTALHFNYGQKHHFREYLAVRRIFKHYKLKNENLISIELPFIGQLFKSALLEGGDDIPDGSYDRDNMGSTVVPFRNGIMLSIAAGYAESINCYHIAIANHAGDHTLYPDCTPTFISNMFNAINIGTNRKVSLESPFLHMNKAEIVNEGFIMKVPLHLTYSCYKGGEKHCGVCGTCRERRSAFKKAGVHDHTDYIE